MHALLATGFLSDIFFVSVPYPRWARNDIPERTFDIEPLDDINHEIFPNVD